MTEPTAVGARARSVGFAAAAVGLAAGAHATAGGELPALPVLVLLGALFEVVGRRRRGPLSTGVGLLGAQVVLHLALAATAPSHGDHMSSAEHVAAGHLAHLVTGLTPAMLLAHGVAALGLGWLLHRGEDAVVAALVRLAPVAAVVPFHPWVGVPGPLVVAPRATGSGWTAVSLHDLSRRGPPLAVAATPV